MYNCRLGCPKCKGDITEISSEDAIREEDTKSELGIVNIFKCPHCGEEFSDVEVGTVILDN